MVEEIKGEKGGKPYFCKRCGAGPFKSKTELMTHARTECEMKQEEGVLSSEDEFRDMLRMAGVDPKKRDGITELFFRKDIEDPEALVEAMRRFKQWPDKTRVMLELWFGDRDVDIAPYLEKLEGGKGEKVKVAPEEAEVSEIDRELEAMEKEDLAELRREMRTLRIRKRLRELKAELEGKPTAVGEGRIVRRPVFDEKGKVVTDPEGGVVYETEYPADYRQASEAPSQDGIILNMLKALSDLGIIGGKREKSELETISTLKELGLLKMEAVPEEIAHKIDSIEAQLKPSGESEELKVLKDEVSSLREEIHKKEEDERFKRLEEKIEEAKSTGAAKTDHQAELETGKDLYHKTVDVVKEVGKDLKDTVKEGLDKLSTDQGAERAHRRFLERIAYGQSLGYSPSEIVKMYEEQHVPAVTEEDLLREMRGETKEKGEK